MSPPSRILPLIQYKRSASKPSTKEKSFTNTTDSLARVIQVDRLTHKTYSISVHLVEMPMPTETTYTKARAQLASLCDKVASTRDPIFIHRRGAEDVALVPAAELRSLIETAHLLRSPKNAQRLITALIRAQEEKLPSETVETLRREFDLGQAS